MFSEQVEIVHCVDCGCLAVYFPESDCIVCKLCEVYRGIKFGVKLRLKAMLRGKKLDEIRNPVE